jgi:hypothetical protein
MGSPEAQRPRISPLSPRAAAARDSRSNIGNTLQFATQYLQRDLGKRRDSTHPSSGNNSIFAIFT